MTTLVPVDDTDPKRMTVLTRQPGYAHVVLEGSCGPAVTVEDVINRFYHSHFGGRSAWVRDGRFGVTVHTD